MHELIVLLGSWVVIAIALGLMWAMLRATLKAYRPEPPAFPTIPAPWPRRYPGCITCEAAEATSRLAMIRHQTRDHAGGVTW